MTVLGRIEQALERKGWTKRHLAGLAGISSGYFTQLGNTGPGPKIKEPSLKMLRVLADHLEVHVEWLAFGTGPRRKKKSAA